jgi:hypothetical protein
VGRILDGPSRKNVESCEFVRGEKPAGAEALHRASAANLAGSLQLCSGCNGRLIKLSLVRPTSSYSSGHDLQLPMPKPVQKRDGHQRAHEELRDSIGLEPAGQRRLGCCSHTKTTIIITVRFCLHPVSVYMLLLRNVQNPVLRSWMSLLPLSPPSPCHPPLHVCWFHQVNSCNPYQQTEIAPMSHLNCSHPQILPVSTICPYRFPLQIRPPNHDLQMTTSSSRRIAPIIGDLALQYLCSEASFQSRPTSVSQVLFGSSRTSLISSLISARRSLQYYLIELA